MGQFLHSITDKDKVTLCYPSGFHPTGTDLIIKYHTLNGNNPLKRNNYIGLWETENHGKIPASTEPIATYPVGITSTDSNKTLLDLPIGQNEYVLGYCLGTPTSKDHPLVSATLSIPAGSFDPKDALMQSVELDIKGDEAAIWLEYNAISNSATKLNGNWVGIWPWKGDMASIEQEVPVFSKHVSATTSYGKMSFDNKLFRSSKYLLCYFLNGFNIQTGKMDFSTLASWIIFETDQ